MKSLIIKGGLIYEITETGGRLIKKDILIENGKILKLGKNLGRAGAEIVDAHNLLVSPGFIDIHSHLREPGQERKEDIRSGTISAIAGGFTSIACMPNTTPVIDSVTLLLDLKERIKRSALIKVYPIASITKGEMGAEQVDFSGLTKCGAYGFSDDGKGVTNSAIMREAFEFSARTSIPILAHEEDPSLSKDGVMAEGNISSKLGFPSIPVSAEASMIARDIILAEETGGHLHICHVTTKPSLALIHFAKNMNIKVTAEVTPHHLILNDRQIIKTNVSPNTKMKPPLMPETHRVKLVESLNTDIIDCIATDHAPHTPEEKSRGFMEAPFGVIGFETAFPILYTHLVLKNKISLEKLLEKMTIRPARILNIPAGILKPNFPADIVLIDLNYKWQVSENFFSRSKNSPFIGWKVKGKIVKVFVDGELRFKI